MTTSSLPKRIQPVAVTGAGVVCAIAGNLTELAAALRQGRCGISAYHNPAAPSIRCAATLRNVSWREALEPLLLERPELAKRTRKVLNNNSPAACLSVCAALQAVAQAGYGEDSGSILDTAGIIVAGNNLDQDFIAENWQRFRDINRIINPKFAITFQDSNHIGTLSEILAIRGPGCTIGAASASGNAALFNAIQWIHSGLTERCLVIGACNRLSPLELEAYALLGAAASVDPHQEPHQDPAKVCRPFDMDHAGFVWGEATACVLLESADSARTRPVPPLAEIVGGALLLDGHHLPDPSLAGEVRAMRCALKSADLAPEQIAYVNAHGTSSPLGDQTECQALQEVFGRHLPALAVNSTKSLTGHCLSAAGVLELLSACIQMNTGFLHPNLNLERPIDPDIHFAGAQAAVLDAEYGLSNGFGFGGINSALVIRRGINPQGIDQIAIKS